MKKILAILMSCTMLTGCATVPGITPGTNPAPIIAQTATVVRQIIAGSIKACSYAPDAAAVSALLASFVPGAGPTIGLVAQIITAICDQVTTLSAMNLGGYHTPVINGISITGRFVYARSHPRAAPTVNGVPITGQRLE